MLTSIMFITLLACALMLCGACYQARAAPKLGLECAGVGSGATPGGEALRLVVGCEPVRCPPLTTVAGSGYGPLAHLAGGWSYEASNLAKRFPPTSEILGSSKRMCKRDRDRHGTSARGTTVGTSNCEDDDAAGPQLATVKPPYRARARMYAGFVRALEAAVSAPGQALAVKVELQSRHPGNRQLINKAFDEAITANVDNDVTNDFVSTFKEVGDKSTANLLRQSLKEEMPAESGFIDEAFRRVYAA